jgi:hypothetical protein
MNRTNQPPAEKALLATKTAMSRNSSAQMEELDTLFLAIKKQADEKNPFYEGIVAELEKTQQKQASQQAQMETDYLSYLNQELKKMSSSLGGYSPEEIDSFTKSAESFEKAAHDEASRVWQGIEDELRKEGADDAFIEGMVKEAVNYKGLADLGNLGLQLLRGGNFGTLAGVGKKMLGNLGASSAIQKILPKAKNFGAFVDDAGKVMHGADLHSMPGARTYNLADDVIASYPELHKTNRKAFDAAKKMRSNAASKLTEGFGSENQGILDKTYMDALHEAEFGAGSAKANAAKAVENIGKGDFSDLASRAGIGSADQARVKTMHGATPTSIHSADRDLVGHLDKMKGHAASAAKEGIPHAPSWADQATTHAAYGSRGPGKGLFRFAPWEGAKGAVKGALGGAMVAPFLGPLGPVAPIVGALGTGAYKAFGPAGVLPAAAIGMYGGKKMLNSLGLGDASPSVDSSGLRGDRHRVVPFMSNKATGAIGGALLAMLIAREMGLEGGAGLIAPILGGIAGYNYLPEMMNKWKDPYGSGANRMNPFAAAYNRANPFIPETPEAPVSYSQSLPPPPAPAVQ